MKPWLPSNGGAGLIRLSHLLDTLSPSHCSIGSNTGRVCSGIKRHDTLGKSVCSYEIISITYHMVNYLE